MHKKHLSQPNIIRRAYHAKCQSSAVHFNCARLPTLATLAGDIVAEGAGVKILEKHIKMESNTCTYWFTLKLEY